MCRNGTNDPSLVVTTRKKTAEKKRLKKRSPLEDPLSPINLVEKKTELVSEGHLEEATKKNSGCRKEKGQQHLVILFSR